ncbi:flagellar biosynthesis protein FlhB domain protein [Leptospira interrogans serovar Bataviae str. UI 08561]|nr:flagellar biosynthesis protein FlhB domain protein [Leptospira interrogans serovar Bataviae str. UI 08561]
MKKAIWSRTKKLVVVFVQNPKRFFIRIFYKNLSRVPWVCESGKNSFVKSVLDVFYRFMLFGKRFGKFIFWKQYYDIVSDFSKKCESSHNLREIKNLMGVPTIYTRSKILWEFPQFTRDQKSCKSSYNLQNVVKSESDSDHFSNRNTVSLQNKQEGLVIKDVVHPTSFIFSFLHHFDRWEQKSTSHSLWMFRTIERFFSIIKKLFFKKSFQSLSLSEFFYSIKKLSKNF